MLGEKSKTMAWELIGNTGTNPATNFLGTSDPQPLVIKTNELEAMRIFFGAQGEGEVTFGSTQTGQSNLSLGVDVAGSSFIQSNSTNMGNLALNPNGGNVGVGTDQPSAKLNVDPQGAGGIVIGNPLTDHGGFTSLLLDISAARGGHARLQAIKSSGTEWGDLVLNPGGGNVGIGTTSPGAKLEVSTDSGIGIVATSQSSYGISGGGGDIGVYAHNLTTPANVVYLATRGLAGDFYGNVSVTGSITVTGDVILTGADCAEEFDTAEAAEIEPGTVMVLDQGGALRQCQQAYDKRVAGVISGAGVYRPGLILDRHQSQGHRVPVALVGKVYCKVDAQYAAIEVGDLLTTSPTLGHAMKADDPLKAFGSVMGKALHSLRDGQGLIPILIALQ